MKNALFIYALLLLICATTNPLCTQSVAPAYEQSQTSSVAAIYGRWYSSPLHFTLTSSKWPSMLAGSFANTSLSRKFIPTFIKKFATNCAEIEQPLESFKTFNEFFIRTLKPGARPFSTDRNTVISPADGTITVIPTIGDRTQFPIKGTTLTLTTLLNNHELAETFLGGTVCIIRLAPWDYHRMHFPVTGIPTAATVIHGRYESVHPFVYASGIQPLEVNERHLIVCESEQFSTVALIPVGALFVGAITETYTPNQLCAQGDELGYFEYGGSTIVLIFKPGTLRLLPLFLAASAAGKEVPIKMGQTIGYGAVA